MCGIHVDINIQRGMKIIDYSLVYTMSTFQDLRNLEIPVLILKNIDGISIQYT